MYLLVSEWGLVLYIQVPFHNLLWIHHHGHTGHKNAERIYNLEEVLVWVDVLA